MRIIDVKSAKNQNAMTTLFGVTVEVNEEDLEWDRESTYERLKSTVLSATDYHLLKTGKRKMPRPSMAAGTRRYRTFRGGR